ncbi:MAG TPA: IclR family transcriptional regulator [Thermodesulfobacteriota bacterium]|nr:IclR family transcriptional regulator [Thermodesulfobacteriota bacterium]
MRDRYLINSVLRAGRILKCLSAHPGRLKTGELARVLRLDRSTTYRLVLSLEKCGLVEKKEKTGEYSLGPGAFEIGSAYLRSVDLVQAAKPIMADLALKVQETIHLAVLSETEIFYLDKVDSPRSVGVISKIGQRGPVHCTALGKVLLSHLPEEERLKIIERIKFQPFTPRTITSPKRFMKELKEVHERGYALDHREIEEDVECVAAPIRDHTGRVIAGLSVSGPQKKIQTPLEKRVVTEVRKAASMISTRMGYMENT